jgi:hypothetical protein
MNLYDYTGVIHFHSKYSYDGYASVSSIIKDAEDCDVDFLMLSDHDHLKARDEGWEGWQGKTLLIVGQEVSPRFNHYLAFNIPSPVYFADDPEGICPQRYMDEVRKKGGFGIIAHPDHEGAPMFHVKHYCWNDWNVSGYAGISIWDFMTDWQKSLNGYLRILMSFLFPAYFLKGPRQVTLDRWDQLNAIQKTVGIGELDNHASIKKLLGIPLIAFPFKKAFRFVRTHVLTDTPFSGNTRQDIDLVFRTLLYGRCYFALDYFCKSSGFVFRMDQDGRTFFMGDSLMLSGPTQLTVAVPRKALIRVIRNGAEWMKAQTTCLEASIAQPGVYRVEAFLKSMGRYRPWIFSNPIFVRSSLP